MKRTCEIILFGEPKSSNKNSQDEKAKLWMDGVT